MLVYCTTLWLNRSPGADSILGVVAEWLSKKARQSVTGKSLQSTGQLRMRDGSRMQTVRADRSFPIMQAIRYTHRDKDVSGREWITEIGLRQESIESEIECCVLLRTNEISARVDSKIQVTRPAVVREIVERCSPSMRTSGLSSKTLNDDSAEAFRYVIGDPDRQYPLIVVSPTQDGKYLIELARLSSLVVGLAEVVRIPPGADTFLIERVVGDQYAAWRGAVNLIFRKVVVKGKTFIPTKRLMAEELEEMVSNGINLETEILSIITHRTNFPNAWRHISPELVLEAILLRELAKKREEAARTGETTELLAVLEDINKEEGQKIVQLQDELRLLEDLSNEVDDENRRLKSENDNLKSALSKAGAREVEIAGPGFSPRIRDAFLNVLRRSPDPQESLLVIATLFPDRVAVLQTAWESAEQSKTFKEKGKVFDLLWKLVTDYWTALVSGKSDAEARGVFGNSYAARESESVEHNKRARQLRTFEYQGKNIEMMKHLKVGNKDSVAETIRIHFAWDSNEHRVVIGYCGPHIDNR